uniref:Anaphase-promoting complex subunit 11 n=4 Tax=Metatheria TaxID=9263 RepID=A0A7N4NVL9_SARHA
MMSSRDMSILSAMAGAESGPRHEPRASARRVQTHFTMKVKIKCWNGVASWLWVANDENCGICRMAFNGCCPDCKVPGDDCPLVWGQCSHCFHMHCILKWLNSQQVQQHCPMCRQEWKFKE